MIRNGSSAGIAPCADVREQMAGRQHRHRAAVDSAGQLAPAPAPDGRTATPLIASSADPLLDERLLVLELGRRAGSAPAPSSDQLELGADMSERPLEDQRDLGRVLGLLELAPQLSPGGLGLQQHGQLVEREAEQVAQADDLADALDVSSRV